MKSTPLEMMAVAVSAAPAEPFSTPETDSIRQPVAAPIAAPPGTVFDTALETSCDVPATNHETVGSATRVSAHIDMYEPVSNRTITTNQRALSVRRRGTVSQRSSSCGSRT